MVLSIVLGAFIDGLSLILVTPVMLPLVDHVGMDPYIFGILLFLLVVLGQITPPLGIDLFVLKSLSRDTTLGEIFRAALPVCAMIILVAVIVFLEPSVAFFLPDSMAG